MGKAGAREAVGGREKLGTRPWHPSPYLPPLLFSIRDQSSRGPVGYRQPGLTSFHGSSFSLLYSLGRMPVNAAEQLAQLPRAEDPIGKVILEFLKGELTII